MGRNAAVKVSGLRKMPCYACVQQVDESSDRLHIGVHNLYTLSLWINVLYRLILREKMAISKTHEKGYTVYCKETRKDLKSLMNKYIKKKSVANRWAVVTHYAAWSWSSTTRRNLSSKTTVKLIHDLRKITELYLRPFLFPADQEAGQAPAGNAHLYCRSLLCCWENTFSPVPWCLYYSWIYWRWSFKRN